jgi:hypothetical protein
MNARPRLGGNLLLLALAALALSATPVRSQAPGPVFVEILADQYRSSPDPLQPFNIRFIVYANGNKIQGMVFAGVFRFTSGNIIGTIDEWPNGDAQIVYSAQTISTFASVAWLYGSGADPDTLLLGLTSFSKPWTGTGEMFRIHVTPTDTGSIQYDSLQVPIPPTSWGGIGAFDPQGGSLPVVVVHSPIHVPPQPGPVRFRISTSSGTDTLFFGVPGTIYFNVDAMGNEIAGLVFGLKWDFTNGSFIGPFSDVTGEVQYSTTALDTYESIGFNSNYAQGTDPDTSLLVLTDFGGTRFSGSDWIWSVTFQPLDTGTVVIDSDFMHPPAWTNIEAMDPMGFDLPASFIPGRIAVVPCPYTLMGDVN